MKRLIHKIAFALLFSATFGMYAQGNYSLEIEQEVQGSNLIMDLYVQKTAGNDFAFSSSNFAIFIDTANLDLAGATKVAAEDGPWDNGTVPASYLDLLLGKGSNFINLTARRNTSGSTVGYNVTSTRTKIGRVLIPIKNSCGTNNAIWNSGPAAQTMMPLQNIKGYATFNNGTTDFPLCEIPANPSLTNVSQLNEICEGEFIGLSTNATEDIQWYKDGIVVLGANTNTYNVTESGVYTVEAINCTACKSLSLTSESVNVKPLPEQPTIEQVGSILTSNISGNLQWYKDGVAIEGANSTTYEPNSNGVYLVKNTNTCGEKVSNELSIESTGITENFEFNLSAFPNPYKGSTVITYTLAKGDNIKIELFDALGKRIKVLDEGSKGVGEYSLKFSATDEGLSEGIYFVKLTLGDESKTIKLVELK